MAPAVTLQPPPSAEQAKQNSREFSLLAQAAGKAGDLASVPREALEGVLHKSGQDGQAPDLPDQLSFDKLAVSLLRGCTHPGAKGQGDCLGLAAHDKEGKLAPMRFPRRALKPHDVRISIAFCGICHSDLHKVKSQWGPTNYPCVPGHEIVGVVTEVGQEVSGFAPGDKAAVGCMVGSCGGCDDCRAGLQQYCSAGAGPVWTYDSEDPEEGGAINRGGYSSHIVLNERFALHLPDNLPMAAAAPLLCAGITTYSPLRHFGLDKPGMHVGVVGLGGLGPMAVKLAKAFGCEVSVISTSPSKRDEALSRLGADKFVVSKSDEDMKAAAGTLDGIIDTVSAPHDLVAYLSLLRTDGKLVLVGLPPEPSKVPAFALTSRRRSVAGSGIGSIEETQEMLDFCGKHGITCEIELIQADYVNQAMRADTPEMPGSAGKRAVTPPDRLEPPDFRVPSSLFKVELGTAKALSQSQARNKEVADRYEQAQEAFFAANGFITQIFEDVSLPGDAAAKVHYLPEGASLLPPADFAAFAAAAERLIPQDSFVEGRKTHKHMKFGLLHPNADGRCLLAAGRDALMPLVEAGGAVPEAELVVRSGAGAEAPHRWGWSGITADMHQDRKTGHITFDRGGLRWLFDMAAEPREFEFVRARDGQVEVLLHTKSRVIAMTPGAAGAGGIGCVYHRRPQPGGTLSVDVSPPNPRKDSVAVRLNYAPAYHFFRPEGRASHIASLEALADQIGARRGTHTAPSAHETAEGRAVTAAAVGVSCDEPHCYVCLMPEEGQEGRRGPLLNVEGLLLCYTCGALGSLERCSQDAAARPAVTAGGHPEVGCLGCVPGPRAKRKMPKRKGSFTTGKEARRNKRHDAARSKAEEAAAAFVAAALRERS